MTMGMMNMRTAATKTTPSAFHAWAHENVQTIVMMISAAMATRLRVTGVVFGSPLFPLGSLSPCGARALFMNHLPFRLKYANAKPFPSLFSRRATLSDFRGRFEPILVVFTAENRVPELTMRCL